MQEFTIDARYDGKNLVRVILSRFSALAPGQVHKALRQKDIRLNGLRCKDDVPVRAGDVVSVYLPDAALSSPLNDTRSRGSAESAYQVIYEDNMLLIVNKRPGITVHQAGGAGREHGPGLIDLLRARYEDERLQLCHRLDRQTGGLILVARNPEALKAVQAQMRQGKLLKRYQCLVRGVPEQGRMIQADDGTVFLEITAWLEKDSQHSDVYIHDDKQPGDLPIVTRYRVLRVFSEAGPDFEDVSELEVELVTGRTHQIRAHLAHLGHPLLGDGKYGRNAYNRHFKVNGGSLTRQQLFATRLIFPKDIKRPLAELAGRIFAIDADYEWPAAYQ